ncbi:hypothetical protein CONPUDRAFT_136535 [Coniophora puteana RWD-64-598 SS2]|uniref:Uncharacterized protein n=1 Tax=Coniophora puteana (strain RWD-64-598) TaxID=741705 RepID=A0A5M3MT90_CONPW|nr:uncharacterized protein CONPUDRAFT_136535 [Coniophora puteana RWD-64-598 SS2]EIW81741.1 hypothetical protein CONPUDRAFT_136535 [Coniophora puteana RWD-64-598 SS2]
MGVSAFRAARTEHDHAREGTADGAPPRNAGGRGQRRGRRGRGRRGRRGRGDDDEDDEEEPFVPVDPWRLRARIRQLSLNTPHIPDLESGLHRVQSNLGIPPEAECHETLTSCLPSPPFLSSLRSHSFPLLRPLSLARVASPRLKRGLEDTWTHFTDTLPRQIYLHILLRLPSLYFARIARVFEDAELSKPDIERMVEACWEGDWASLPQGRSHSHGPRRTHGRSPGHAHHSPSPPPRLLGQGLVGSPRASLARGLGIGATSAPASLAAGNDDAHEEGGATDEWALPFPEEWVSGAADVPPSIVRFKRSWEEFIDSLLREWKTLNLVSALLLSAILSMFQNTQMSLDPLIRTPALISLTCALMSLSYGCVYIVRFGTMRTMHNALRWADEARHTETSIWWNVWVLLAMPAVWLAWSMVSFVVAILAFVWRSGADSDPQTPNQLGSRAVLGPRVGISMLFVLGVVYFGAMVRTLGSYGYGRRGAREAARYPPMHLYLSNSRPTSTSPPPPDYLERERDVGLVGARRPGAFTPPPAISPTPRTSLDDRDRVGRTVFPPDRGTGEPQRGRDRTTRRGADIGRPRRASDAQIPLSAVTGLGLMNLPGDGSGSGVNLSGSGNGNGNGNSEATPRSSDSLVMTEKEAL